MQNGTHQHFLVQRCQLEWKGAYFKKHLLWGDVLKLMWKKNSAKKQKKNLSHAPNATLISLITDWQLRQIAPVYIQLWVDTPNSDRHVYTCTCSHSILYNFRLCRISLHLCKSNLEMASLACDWPIWKHVKENCSNMTTSIEHWRIGWSKYIILVLFFKWVSWFWLACWLIS